MIVDPESVDWQQVDDLEVILSARAGIQQAIAEAKARSLTY